MDGDVAHLRVAFELIENPQAGMIGKVYVEKDGVRPIVRGGGQSLVGRVGHDALEAHFMRQVPQDGGEAGVVLDDENEPGVGVRRSRSSSMVIRPERRR